MKRLLVGLAILASATLLLLAHGVPTGTALADVMSAATAPTLASVAVSESVTGGETVVVTVTLSGRATVATRVLLTSSDRAALPTRGSVTVLAGRSSASVTVRSVPVSRSTRVTVSAKLGSTTRDDRATVLPPTVSAVSLPASVGGGLSAAGTVTLTGPAPEGGVLVAMRANRPSRLGVPASVRVAARRTTASFVVTSVGGVDVPSTDVTVSARLGVGRSDVIEITALRVAIDLPPRLFADVPVTGRVVLNGLVAGGGPALEVTLAMSVPTSSEAPASVTIQPGTSSAALGFTPVAAPPDDRSGITAQVVGQTGVGSSAFRHLEIESNIEQVTVRPGARGAVTTGTIRLHQPYPAPADIKLTLGNPTVATLPATVRIPAGQRTAGFDVQLDANGRSTLSATYKSSATSMRDALDIGLRGGLEASSSRVYAGVTTSVRLRIEPLPYPVSLRLRSSDPSVIALGAATLLVPADATGGIVEIPIQVKGLGPVTLSASYDGVTISGVVASHHVVRSIDLLEPPVVGTVRAELTLNLARGRGYEVTLTSSNVATFTVPTSVTVPAGESTVSFPIEVVSNQGPADLRVMYGGVTVSMVVAPAFPTVASVAVPAVYAGMTTTATVTLSGPTQSTSPMLVELRSSAPGVATVPASVTVPAGAMSAQFPVTGVGAGPVELSARANGSVRSADVVVGGIVASLAAPRVSLGLPGSGTVTLAIPAPQDVVVGLSVGDEGIAGLPATVVVPAGGTSAPFAITGLAAGGTTLTAEVGGVGIAAELSVEPLFDGMTASGEHYVDVDDLLTLRLTRAAPHDVEVTLTSSDPAAAAVASSVGMARGEREVSVRVTSLAAGTTQLTASLGGQTVSWSWTVVAPRLVSVSASAAYVGLSTTGLVTLAGPAEVDTEVSLRAGGGALLVVPGSIVIPAGETSGAFTVEGRLAGETEIRARVSPAYDRAAPVTVVQIVGALSLSDALAGESATGTVTLVAPAPHALDIALRSANTTIATVPATLTIPAGATSMEFPVTVLGVGRTRITLSFGALELGGELTVGGGSVLANLSIPPAYAGIPALGQVELASPATEATELRLSSSDPSVATVPASITIPAGERDGLFAISTVGEGDATITVGLGDEEIEQPLSVTAFIEGITHGPLYPMSSGTIRVTFKGPAASPLQLDLAAGSPAIDVPSAFSAPLGSAFVDIEIWAQTSGDVTLTITLNGHPYVGTVRVSPLLSGIACAACPVFETQVGSAALTVGTAPVNGISVALSSDDPSVVTVPDYVGVTPGETSMAFSITALAAGRVTITATWSGEAVTLTLDVGANALAASGPTGAIPAGAEDVSASVSLSVAPGNGEVVVTVAVGDAAVVAAPATVTIAVGSTTAVVPLTGVAPGTTTVTVTANGQTSSFDVTVVEE